MTKKKFIIAIIREARADENRSPITPKQAQTLISKYPNLHILVQASKKRCFRDKDYLNAGAEITDDTSNADFIFGVKEVDISALVENKTYLFFSHTTKVRNYINQATQDKAIIYKKELLREILKKKCYFD